MGRLQKKKPVGKKKKKRAGEGESSDVSKGAGAEKNIIALTDFSKAKKKVPAPQSKAAMVAKPSMFNDGKIYKIRQFIREVKIELKKVTWPSRTQTMGSTAVVIVLVMIISMFLGLVDVGLSNLVRTVLH
jgi:preprotein translocase subunit SecE